MELSLTQRVLIVELTPIRINGVEVLSPKKDPATEAITPEVVGMLKLILLASDAPTCFELPTVAQDPPLLITMVNNEPKEARVLAEIDESEVQKEVTAAQ